MNLKDAILSTISEIQNHEEPKQEDPTKATEPFRINESPAKVQKSTPQEPASVETSDIMEDQFLKDLRERILVLFEGFQSPNNANIEAKVDLTLNFLEHLLAKIDAKLEKK
jgi:hypothetical protein